MLRILTLGAQVYHLYYIFTSWSWWLLCWGAVQFRFWRIISLYNISWPPSLCLFFHLEWDGSVVILPWQKQRIACSYIKQQLECWCSLVAMQRWFSNVLPLSEGCPRIWGQDCQIHAKRKKHIFYHKESVLFVYSNALQYATYPFVRVIVQLSKRPAGARRSVAASNGKSAKIPFSCPLSRDSYILLMFSLVQELKRNSEIEGNFAWFFCDQCIREDFNTVQPWWLEIGSQQKILISLVRNYC